MNNLAFSYPTWFLLLCILLGGAYALLLYFRENRFAESATLRYTLAALRFVAVTVIAILLLDPVVRYFEGQVEPPIVVIAVDHSQSMTMGKDSAEVRQMLPAMVDALQNDLGSDYLVTTYSFGQEVKEGLDFDFSDPLTDLSAVFAEINNRYTNRNLGAVVLTTDGIYNRGSNPRYTVGATPWKVLPIAMGDTAVQRDAHIGEVGVNRIAYLGNKFPIEVVLEASKLIGRKLNFSVLHNGAVLHSESVAINNDSFRHTLRLLLDASKVGTQRYTLRIAPIEGEVSFSNNTREVFIDVIDSRQKVLVLAASPHPDISALRSAISSNENYEVEVKLITEFNGTLDQYDLVVLHQLPATGNKSEELRLNLLQSEKPMLAIVGSQTLVPLLSRTGLGVDLASKRGSFHDVGATVAEGFASFKIDESLNNFLRDAPPLKAPFGQWRVANSADVLLYQRVGSIKTDEPLMFVNQTSDRKVAVLLGEGLWRWRLYDYASAQSHARFDGFISSLVQYLALKADKRFFKLNYERSFMENERILFGAELYNDAYEPINDSEVKIDFNSEDGRDYPFVFSRTATAYRLEAGALPIGTYSFVASTTRGGTRLEERGSITVKPFALEGANLTANHNLLKSLADATNGRVFYPSQANEIGAYLRSEATMKPVRYTTEVFDTVMNLKWIFFLILGLLSLEWFLRKRSGNY